MIISQNIIIEKLNITVIDQTKNKEDTHRVDEDSLKVDENTHKVKNSRLLKKALLLNNMKDLKDKAARLWTH